MIRLLEEISLNAWPAVQTILYDGWVLRFANGYTRRANSVNPLYAFQNAVDEKIAFCEQIYRHKGLPVVFKITPASQPGDLDALLTARDYRADSRTSVQLLELDRWHESAHSDILVSEELGQEWFTAFCELGQLASSYHSSAWQILQLFVPTKGLNL